MPVKKNNITVLIAPLDWGLGHATRCIPVIRELKENGCAVLIASTGLHKNLLVQEFPDADFTELPGYGIRYGKSQVLLRLLLQLPLFIKHIRTEHRWLQQAIDKYKIDAVVSDNRYGLHSTKVPCIFVTHQLQVQLPAPFKWMEKTVRNKLYGYIKKFTACWVPDVADYENSLGRALSHPVSMPPVPVTYLGWLTRFSHRPSLPKTYRLLISLSGPEPQRSLLEDLLLIQLKNINEKVLLIRGLPGNWAIVTAPSQNITIINHLAAHALQTAIAESDLFLSRCGYSTLMDLQAVQCRCIFVPTPGQTEQEYLGKQILSSGKALVLPQNQIDLNLALNAASTLPFFSDGIYQNSTLKKIIRAWLVTIRK